MAECSKYTNFDPLAYIKKKYVSVTEWNAKPLRELHQVFASLPPPKDGQLKVLDYGCGPVPIYLSSAPPVATEIVFAEYEKRNRDVLETWLNKDPTAPDYTPIFKYVVQELEGQQGEELVAKRQDDLRHLVKGVVHCDITKDPPIAMGYEGPYDVIFSSLCLNVAAINIKEYSDNMRRLTTLLKPGGMLIINAIESMHGTYHSYWVGDEEYYSVSVSEDSLKCVLEQNGYTDIRTSRQSVADTPGALEATATTEAIGMILGIARKL